MAVATPSGQLGGPALRALTPPDGWPWAIPLGNRWATFAKSARSRHSEDLSEERLYRDPRHPGNGARGETP
jgi:hypothetical protein